jgi:hypothetical protein
MLLLKSEAVSRVLAVVVLLVLKLKLLLKLLLFLLDGGASSAPSPPKLLLFPRVADPC